MEIMNFNFEENGKIYPARRLDTYKRLSKEEQNLLSGEHRDCQCGSTICLDGILYVCTSISPASSRCTWFKTTQTC